MDLSHVQREDNTVSVFMGVPTMYSHLLSYYDDMSAEEQEAAKQATQRLRLTVSGSAACPLPIMQRWHALSGACSCVPSPRLPMQKLCGPRRWSLLVTWPSRPFWSLRL